MGYLMWWRRGERHRRGAGRTIEDKANCRCRCQVLKLGSNKFGFELELALEERGEGLGVENNAACVIALFL